MARDTPEGRWQGKVLDVAALHRWEAYHVPDSRQATMSGFPDLTLIKGGRVVYAELKAPAGRVSDHQRFVLSNLAASGAEVALWRPADLADVMAVLGRAGRRAALPADFRHDLNPPPKKEPRRAR